MDFTDRLALVVAISISTISLWQNKVSEDRYKALTQVVDGFFKANNDYIEKLEKRIEFLERELMRRKRKDDEY